MSKKAKKTSNRNTIAYAMIVSGTGKKQVFADKRMKRQTRKSWKKDIEQ